MYLPQGENPFFFLPGITEVHLRSGLWEAERVQDGAAGLGLEFVLRLIGQPVLPVCD